MTLFAVISFCSFISIQELNGFPYFYSFILCKYTLLTTTRLFLFLCSYKFQGRLGQSLSILCAYNAKVMETIINSSKKDSKDTL